MDNQVVLQVEMTHDELVEFHKFKLAKEKEFAVARAKEDRETYKELVEECIRNSAEELLAASQRITETKKAVLARFEQAVKIKCDLFGVEKSKQFSHTFTNQDSTIRISIGNYMLDKYDDTADEGVAMIKQEIANFASDEKTKSLVNIIMNLLAKDKAGNLKTSRVLQLEREALKLGNERILQGAIIIKEAYKPERSKTFITLETKMEDGSWKSVPLGMTEA